MTVASSAIAAPPVKGKGAKKAKAPAAAAAAPVEPAAAPQPEEAVVQSSDPPPAEGGGTPAPAPAPAEAAPAAPAATPAESTQPAVTLGGSAVPGADIPGASAEEPKKKPPMRRWAGSQIASYTSVSTATLIKSQQNDYNPTVDTSLWFLPRFAISESFQLRGLLVFNYEFTNSDSTTTRNEPRFSDTLLSLWYRKIPEIPGVGIKPMVSVSLGLPTSPESRARTLIANPGLGFQLVKGIEHVLGGELDIIASTTYSHPLYRYETPERRDPGNPQQCAFGDASSCAGQLTGQLNPSDVMNYSLIVAGEWGKWSPAIMYRGTSQWAYRPTKSVNETVSSGNTQVPISQVQGFEATNVRQLSYFSFWLDYNANSFFTAEVGYWMSRNLLDDDGQVGNPFFNRYKDMRVYLGLSLNVDNLMKTLEGGAGEAGIVRAKNNRGPAVTFY
ncbi:MAG: hypothetical protein JST00_13070 [Deltaproteobacteria bacterium]|nr:hypothetical protein [Deltaproteobacteria bacterium]